MLRKTRSYATEQPTKLQTCAELWIHEGAARGCETKCHFEGNSTSRDRADALRLRHPPQDREKQLSHRRLLKEVKTLVHDGGNLPPRGSILIQRRTKHNTNAVCEGFRGEPIQTRERRQDQRADKKMITGVIFRPLLPLTHEIFLRRAELSQVRCRSYALFFIFWRNNEH